MKDDLTHTGSTYSYIQQKLINARHVSGKRGYKHKTGMCQQQGFCCASCYFVISVKLLPPMKSRAMQNSKIRAGALTSI